jgi:putative ABC transport system substrate-binding protein
MISRRAFIAGAIAVVSAPLANAQKTGETVRRVGYLNAGTPAMGAPLLDAFRRGLRELGYVEGRNLRIEARWAEGYVERLPRLATELVQLKVDVIVTGGAPQVLAAKHATSTIPIVMVAGADPVALGFAASLARPGGNITGLSNMATETAGKLVQFAHEIVPKATRVAILMSDNPTMKDNWIDAQKAGKQLKLRLVPVKAKNPEELEGAFASALKEKAEVLVVPADPFFSSQLKRIVELAARRKLPSVWSRSEFVRDGGLISYGPNYTELYRRAAIFVDKIFKGSKPGEIPFEQPTKFELVVNRKTAQALGIKIPQSILLQANEVIE